MDSITVKHFQRFLTYWLCQSQTCEADGEERPNQGIYHSSSQSARNKRQRLTVSPVKEQSTVRGSSSLLSSILTSLRGWQWVWAWGCQKHLELWVFYTYKCRIITHILDDGFYCSKWLIPKCSFSIYFPERRAALTLKMPRKLLPNP